MASLFQVPATLTPLPWTLTFEVILKKRAVPVSRHADYKKWLRYYLDFRSKYSLPDSKSENHVRKNTEITSKKTTIEEESIMPEGKKPDSADSSNNPEKDSGQGFFGVEEGKSTLTRNTALEADRLVYRLKSDMAAYILPPDASIKMRFAEHQILVDGIEFPDADTRRAILNYIVEKSVNLREVKGMIGTCNQLLSLNRLTARKFFAEVLKKPGPAQQEVAQQNRTWC